MIDKKYVSYILMFLCFIGGLGAIFQLDNIEDIPIRFAEWTRYSSLKFNALNDNSIFSVWSNSLNDASRLFSDFSLSNVATGLFTLATIPVRIMIGSYQFIIGMLNVFLKFFVYVLFGGGSLV